MSLEAEEPISCSEPGCCCLGFRPGSVQLRSCDRCGHGWVAHALETLSARPASGVGPVEVALPGLVFDLSSLVLFGSQAVPVQMKILLDRLYSILTPEQVGGILQALGWSLGDYIRGYMLQCPSGSVLDRWLMVTPEEQQLILKQFLRFGETRPIVELMLLQSLRGDGHGAGPGSEARLKPSQQEARRRKGALESHLVANNGTTHHSEDLPGQSRLLPFHFPLSTIQCFLPSNKDIFPSCKFTQILQKPSGTRPAEKHQPGGEMAGKDHDLTWKKSECDPGSSIKPDPDISKPSLFLWHQKPVFQNDQELLLQRETTRQEKAASFSSPFNSSVIPSLLHPATSTSSSSGLQRSQKLQRPPSSLNPLPSFSSSFLCPLRSSSFSSPLTTSSLHPVPSSLCTFPSLSLAGGRKGRVCCGVCGKSFYDKGTLKIHYNAVHLKIKHRCTIAGCTMVFSSLRSRNRHSANPNPRLHTGASRGTPPYQSTRCEHADTETQSAEGKQELRHKQEVRMCRETCNTFWKESNDAQPPVDGDNMKHGVNRHKNPHPVCRCNTSHQAGPRPHPQTVDHVDPNSNQGLTLDKPQSQSPPQTAASGGSPSCCTSRPWQWRLADPLPKKKPRKSSMPVKIERK